jgi:hypothetical protein
MKKQQENELLATVAFRGGQRGFLEKVQFSGDKLLASPVAG